MPAPRPTRLITLLAALAAACSSGSGGGSPPVSGGSMYAISGTITGLGGATVEVALSGTSVSTISTDASGMFTFGGLSDGTYTIAPVPGAFTFSPSAKTVAVNGASRAGQDFAATAAAGGAHRLSGTVSGASVSGVIVALAGDFTATTVTNSAGAFAFDGLADGSYTLTPSLRGAVFTPATRSVTVSGSDVPGQDFVSAPDPYSTGCSITFGGPISQTLGCTVISAHYQPAYLGALWTFGINTDAQLDPVHSILEIQTDAVPSLPAMLALTNAPVTVLSALMLVSWQDGGEQWVGGKGQGVVGGMSLNIESEVGGTAGSLGTVYRPHGTLDATLEPAVGAPGPLTVQASF